MKEPIYIIKDISGVPHAISSNELNEALKNNVKIFGLTLEEISKLR